MHYDFIEIGSHYSCTHMENAPVGQRGIVIEPVQEYLDRLPNHEGVTKLAVAVVDDESVTEMDLFYISEADIKRHGLHHWMSQCNQLGSYHPWHLEYYQSPKVRRNPINLVERGIVKTRRVPCITFQTLTERYDVSSIDYVKIDAEGYDCRIVDSILKTAIRPKKIQFETHGGWGQGEVDATRSRLIDSGYLIEITETDTVATLIRV